MKILDKYIGIRFLTTFFFIITLLLLISIVIDLTENLDEMLEQGTSALPIARYYLNFAPWIMSILAPLFVFISVIFFTSRLTNNSEIIATISGGVSFYRLLLPYLVSGGIIATLFFFSNHFLLPKANADIMNFKTKYLGKRDQVGQSNNIHIQLKDNRILYLQSYAKESKVGYNLQLETFKGKDITYKLRAKNIQYIDSTRTWLAKDVSERFLTPDTERFEKSKTKQLDLPLIPSDFIVKKDQWTTLTTPELNRAMKREREKGTNLVKFYQLEKHKRTSTPVAIIIFTVMGVAIASRKVRGGTGIHLAIGILLSAIFVLMLNFSETFAENANTSPVLSVWIPNMLFGVIAIVLVFRAQK